MRRLVLLVVCAVVLSSFGCKKEETAEPRKMPPRRLFKPGDNPGAPKPLIP
jgi:hypothetical protein